MLGTSEVSSRLNESKPLLDNEGFSGHHCQSPEAAVKENVRPFGSLTSISVNINYIVGTGCIGLPYAFSKSGLALNSILLFVGLIFCTISMNYMLEIIARGQGLFRHRLTQQEAKENKLSELDNTPVNVIGYEKLGFTTLAMMFGNTFGGAFTQASMSLYSLGSLWLYGTVFSSTLTSLFVVDILKQESCNSVNSSTCDWTYLGFMLLYGIIVISLSLKDVGDQAFVQKMLTAYRLTAFMTIFIVLSIKLYVEGSEISMNRIENIGAFNWTNFGVGFGSSMLALNCQYNIPDALQPLSNEGNARVVVFTALFLSTALYFGIGILGAIAFDKVFPIVTLNWSTYTGCGNGWDVCETNFIGVIVKLLIMLFPVFNVVSSFPLIVVTIGDNICSVIGHHVKRIFATNHEGTICRLMVSVPPLLLAAYFKKMEIIFSISGLFGFVLALIIPCFVQLASVNYYIKAWDSNAAMTPYTWWPISNRIVSSLLLIVGFGLLSVAISSLIASL